MNLQPYFIVFIVMLLASFIFTYSVQHNPVAGLSFAVGIENTQRQIYFAYNVTIFCVFNVRVLGNQPKHTAKSLFKNMILFHALFYLFAPLDLDKNTFHKIKINQTDK